MPAIPTTIHYCWFSGQPLNELNENCIESWRRAMPDWDIQLWDESRVNMATPYVRAAYKAKMYAFVADYARLQILYDVGGIYLDTDVEVVRDFRPLLDHDLFFGLQDPDSIGVSVIGAVKGHPFLQLVLKTLDEEAARGRLSYEPLPELVTRLALSNPSLAPFLFPEDHFYPYNPYSAVPLRRKPMQAHLSERTFCLHHWQGTWLGVVPVRQLITSRVKALLQKAKPVAIGACCLGMACPPM